MYFFPPKEGINAQIYETFPLYNSAHKEMFYTGSTYFFPPKEGINTTKPVSKLSNYTKLQCNWLKYVHQYMYGFCFAHIPVAVLLQ